MTFLVAQAPVTRHTYYPEAKETPDEARERYEAISEAIQHVVYDPAETPLFKGSDGRARTAAVIESTMWHESAFRKDVDLGLGKHGVGDSGTSWCLMQVQVGHMKKNGHTEHRIIPTPDGAWAWTTDLTKGYGGEDLVTDREACVRVGLHILRVSFRACHDKPVTQWLSLYASGSCEMGHSASELRMGFAMKWFATHRPGFHDADVMTPPASFLTSTAKPHMISDLPPLTE
jgi:hypothetical protein